MRNTGQPRFTIAMGTFALLTLLASSTAWAANGSFGAVGSDKVSVKDMALMAKPSGMFSDKYTIEAKFKGGGDAYFSIHHSSFGVGGKKFEVKARYTAPDGTVYRLKEKFGGGKWSQRIARPAEGGPKALELTMGRHSLKGTPRKWTFVATHDDWSIELEFRPTAPPWRPGEGRVGFPGGRFLDMTVLAPRAKVSGTVRVGEEVRELAGRGYALHSYTNMGLYQAARRMVGFRTERGKLAFYFKEIVPPESLGMKPIRWLLVASRGKVIFESTDFELSGDDFKVDQKHENRYRVPHLLKLVAKDGDKTFTAVVKTSKKRERADRLANLSKVERAVASRFAKPVYYAFFAKYSARLEQEGQEPQTFKGKGIYEMDHLNK